MSIEELRNFCLSLSGTTEDIKWGDHLCFSVVDKLFMITSPDTFPVSVSFKTNDEGFEQLLERGFKPAPYLGRNKWIIVADIEQLSDKDWQYYVKIAHHTIAQKLSTKKRKELGIF